jgi:hypothetical protein
MSVMEFPGPYYRLCTDEDCPYAFAFRDPYPASPHWHFIGSPHHEPE